MIERRVRIAVPRSVAGGLMSQMPLRTDTSALGFAALVFLSLGLIAPTAAADTYPRQPGVDALHYAFRVTLRDDSNEIAGEATADIRFVKDGVTEFALDLTSAAAGGKGMTVSAVTSGGAPVRFVHEQDRL